MPELTRRYVVMTMAAAAPFDPSDHDIPFVLRPWKDPAALAALRTYRDHCYPELASDLDAWIRVIESGPPVRGDVGERNEAHLAASRAARARAARRAAARGSSGPGRAAARGSSGPGRAAARGSSGPGRAAKGKGGARRAAARPKGGAGAKQSSRPGQAARSSKPRKRR